MAVEERSEEGEGDGWASRGGGEPAGRILAAVDGLGDLGGDIESGGMMLPNQNGCAL